MLKATVLGRKSPFSFEQVLSEGENMKGMKAAIATAAWGFVLSFVVYGVVGLLAHYTKLFPPLPLYVATVVGYTVAIMSSYDED